VIGVCLDVSVIRYPGGRHSTNLACGMRECVSVVNVIRKRYGGLSEWDGMGVLKFDGKCYGEG